MDPVPVTVETVLCPTDFSVFSSRALRHAIALARQLGARLRVAHVAAPFGVTARSPFPPTVADATAQVREQTRAELRRFVQPAVEAHVPVETEIREGEPWRELLALAEELPADLVVLGTHGRSGFGRLVLGSVTEKLLNRLPCPVLTVCHEEGRTWAAPGFVGRILCATDLSGSQADTTAFARLIAARSRAALTLLHVVDDRREGSSEGAALAEGGEEERLRDAANELAARLGIEVTGRLARGRVHREILRVAAEEQADLIVMGRRRTSPHRFVSGSSTRRVVREATCPVLTVGGLQTRRRAARADELALTS